MIVRTFQWNGKHVSFRAMPDGEQFIKARKGIYREPDVCPLCKCAFSIESTTGVVLIISNQAGIPNRFVHEECLEDKTDEYAFQLIVQDYKTAQLYKDWFPKLS